MNDTSWSVSDTLSPSGSLIEDILSTTVKSNVFDSLPTTSVSHYSMSTNPPPLPLLPEEICYFHESLENYMITAAFVVIFGLSVLGNALVIIVILTQRQMRSITNIYLMNLAISDLMLSVICMPSTLVSMVANCWMFGAIMCKALAYLQPVVVTASAYTLAVIAIERYYAICRPLHSRIWQTRSHAYCMISLVWLIAIAANVLCLFMYEQKTYSVTGLMCAPIMDPWKHFAYQCYMTIVLLMVPLVLMTALYGSVIKSLRMGIKMDIAATEGSIAENDNSLDDTEGSRKTSLIQKITTKVNGTVKVKTSVQCPPRKEMMQSVRSTHTQKSAAAKQRVVRMLIVIVIIFFCCWTPSYIWWLILLAGDSFPGALKVWNSELNSFITVLTYLSSCTNPITYCFLNKKFRTAILATFGRKTLIRQHFQKVYMPNTNGNYLPNGKGINNNMQRSMSQTGLPFQIGKEVVRRSSSNMIPYENTDPTTKLLQKDMEQCGKETNC